MNASTRMSNQSETQRCHRTKGRSQAGLDSSSIWQVKPYQQHHAAAAGGRTGARAILPERFR